MVFYVMWDEKSVGEAPSVPDALSMADAIRMSDPIPSDAAEWWIADENGNEVAQCDSDD
jgi:hypothetical protein